MAMKENIQECFPLIDRSLNDEFDFLAGADPVWILNWLTGHKYILKPKKRIILSPNTKEDLFEWVRSDAFSSNCLSLEKYINGQANEKEMLEYAKDLVRGIEYEENPERLREKIRSARWSLNKIELIIKEL